MNFADFRIQQDKLQAAYDAAKQGIEPWKSQRLANGLTPDSVKALPEWQAAKRNLDLAWQALRGFNATHCKRFRREISAEIEARRKARLEACP